MGPYTFNFSWLRKEKPNHSILFLEKSYLVVFLHKLMEHWSLNISESVNLRNLFLFLWLRSKDDLRHFGRNNLKQKSYKYRTENFLFATFENYSLLWCPHHPGILWSIYFTYKYILYNHNTIIKISWLTIIYCTHLILKFRLCFPVVSVAL